MTGQIRLQSTRIAGHCRKALLPVAVSMAMMSLSAHAADPWVATHTQAALLKAAAPVSAASVSAQAQSSGYSLNIKDTPSLGSASVSALESSQPLNVVVGLKLRNADRLDALLAEINKPGSANYHKYLTPAQFKAQYAPTEAQVQAVVAHLKQSGFTNITVAPNNLLVSADGNGLGAAAAFHVNMKRFNFKGESHFANDAPAMVPAALGGIVNSVLGLNDVSKMHTLNQRFTPIAQLKHASVQAAAAGSQVAHQPTDFAQIYDVGTTPAASNTTVGIITWGSMTQTIKDLGTFTSGAGLPTANTLVSQTSTGTYANNPGDNGEWSIDSQTIVGTSGGVKQLIFYTGPTASFANITSAYNLAVTNNVAKIINVSLGGNEADTAASGTQAADDAIFKQAVTQGQIFSVASGDSGVYEGSTSPQGRSGYIGTYSSGVVTPISNLGTYAVSEPATSPYVIAVGGTALSTTGATSWAGETTWGWTSGLTSLQYCDVDSNGNAINNSVCLGATGGGISANEIAPAWQTTALGSSVTNRVLPDLAFEGDPASGVNVTVNGASQQYGGTSLASPIFVGLWARIESANANAIGFPGSNFYQAFSNSANAALLHDVTSGNNGYNGYGYQAGAGFDYTTGFGSFDTAKVAAYAKTNWVSGGGTTNVPPVANFSDTVSGLTVSFTDSSTDSDGSIASRSWNFGDGSTSTTTSPSHTYAAAGTYSVSLTVTDNGGATNTKTQSVTVSSGSTGGLQNGVAVTGLSAAKGKQLNYTVNVPAGASNLKIAISGGTGDADLYVKFGSAPTTSSYDCRPYVTGNNESCSATTPQAGTYYILLNGYAAFSGVSLKATWN